MKLNKRLIELETNNRDIPFNIDNAVYIENPTGVRIYSTEGHIIVCINMELHVEEEIEMVIRVALAHHPTEIAERILGVFLCYDNITIKYKSHKFGKVF